MEGSKIQRITLNYEDFCRKISWFNEEEFQNFCSRFQKVMNRRFKATKAIGPEGDLANDGIIDNTKRLAVYAIHHDTMNKDHAIALKMKSDFNKMMKTNPLTSTMVFMTRTTEGMGPKVQKMKEYLESENYFKHLYLEYEKELKEKGKINNIPFSAFPSKKIEYVDCFDLFNCMVDINNVITWEYLLDNQITLPTISELPNRQLDDSAFMSEWLQAAIIRFDNIEAPMPMKVQEIKVLRDNLLEKINRDLRKYKVKNISEIPYEPWSILAILTPNSEHSHTFSPSFEVPDAWGTEDVSEINLTPGILLSIVDVIMFCVKTFKKEEELFIDLFFIAYRIIYSRKIKSENPKIDEHNLIQIYQEFVLRTYQWKKLFTEWLANQTSEQL
ncbi:hypothetical protein CEH05_18105 [Halobacillus halophilus]|uniref:Uncharacterized protein n=1 Tax=Halobacillus halophilus (strain ATCC 35676 / DSM 2266 / JCM 20832 / KCTC 3685 / LMG 17431 / NBRC 102448 / NCIMB 2269) TaxID=866895 RepID=I0JSA6_HALH3|nr:hypothetical protein [Halobacillus halophilus]ASF40965.1 hypothetical protein CEH05_18105 [Halobacillus halophilus]CCG47027.1 hypothetical protein HBHAL_4689 [Halobacillus halophilus DSM 2266]